MRDRCIGINADIQVAGGFAVFVALVLGALHVGVIVVRAWEVWRCGWEGVVGWMREDCDGGWVVRGGEGRGEKGVAGQVDGSFGHDIDTFSRLSPSSVRHVVHAAPSDESNVAPSISAEERSTSVRFVDWSAERAEQRARRRTSRTAESEEPEGTVKWSEVLLECLTDG